MTQPSGGPENFHTVMRFWSRLWQMQIEHSLRFWALWSQASVTEAKPPAPVVRTTPSRPASQSAAARKNPAKPAAKPKAQGAVVVSLAPPRTTPQTMPAARPRSNASTAKAGSEDPAKPATLH